MPFSRPDTANAFVSQFVIEGAADGPLAGLTFAAKDLYDIAGHQTGCGSPDWIRTHDEATETATAVQALLDAGARLVGKTHTDEIAYSLMGANAHFGTPLNTKAPDRVPGGSSSGSASAVAADLADIGLGSDTGGSVRLPASFCGLFGIRTTHGAIALDRTMPLAPSYDTAGWFAQDAATFERAGRAYGLVHDDATPQPRLLIADDLMERTTPDGRDTFTATLKALQDRYGTAQTVRLCPTQLVDWREVFRITQAAEIWQVHGAWVRAANPSFGPGVKQRFEMAAAITAEEAAAAKAKRTEIAARLTDMLGDDGVIIAPTSPGAAPLKSADDSSLDSYRMAALELLCPAGIAGAPQVNLPVGEDEGAPLGLSLIGPRGGDGLLLRMTADLAGQS
jgi:amidase